MTRPHLNSAQTVGFPALVVHDGDVVIAYVQFFVGTACVRLFTWHHRRNMEDHCNSVKPSNSIYMTCSVRCTYIITYTYLLNIIVTLYDLIYLLCMTSYTYPLHIILTLYDLIYLLCMTSYTYSV